MGEGRGEGPSLWWYLAAAPMKSQIKTDKYLPLGQGLITALDLAGYNGRSGYTIKITTRGDHQEQKVRVVIRDLLGCAIEDGFAKWDETTATWCYLTTANVLLDEILLVTAMAW